MTAFILPQIDTREFSDALEALTGHVTVFPMGYIVRYDNDRTEWCAYHCVVTGLPSDLGTIAPLGFAANALSLPLAPERVGGWPTKEEAAGAVERLLDAARVAAGGHDEGDDDDLISAMIAEGSPVQWSDAGGAR